VALLYQADKFQPENTVSAPLMIRDENGEQVLTRDQLVVSGRLDGEKIHFIVNHWPSRYGGEESSRPFRKEAALLTRALVDSIMATESERPKLLLWVI
jgi:hypothetical protein